MFVTMSSKRDTREEAEDALAGHASMPFYIMGYVEVTPNGAEWRLVSIWQVTDGPLLRGQREVTKIATGEAAKNLGLVPMGEEVPYPRTGRA